MNTRCHTYTGQGFDPFDPCHQDVKIEDIAHHLAMICRYGGACPVFYSVAEHAVRVSKLVERVTGNARTALLALHHDSAEAYIHDIRRPIKNKMMVDYDGHLHIFETFEGSVEKEIRKAFSLPDPDVDERDIIRAADDTMLRVEFRGLFGEDRELTEFEKIFKAIDRPTIVKGDTWSWAAAEGAFIGRHDHLMRAAKAARKATRFMA